MNGPGIQNVNINSSLILDYIQDKFEFNFKFNTDFILNWFNDLVNLNLNLVKYNSNCQIKTFYIFVCNLIKFINIFNYSPEYNTLLVRQNIAFFWWSQLIGKALKTLVDVVRRYFVYPLHLKTLLHQTHEILNKIHKFQLNQTDWYLN